MNTGCQYKAEHEERFSIIDAKILDIDRRVEMLEARDPMPSGTFFTALKTIQDAQARIETMMTSFQSQLAELAGKIALHQSILSGDQADVVRIKTEATDKRTRLLCAFGLTAAVVASIFFKPTLADITSFNVITYASCGWLFGESFINVLSKNRRET